MSPRRSPIQLLLFVLLAAGLAYGVSRILTLRFERSDIFPPYSSLRADPLGARALHDSLSEPADIRVSRNYAPLENLDATENVTLFYAGASFGPKYDASMRFPKGLREFVYSGGRLILAFEPILGGERARRSLRETHPSAGTEDEKADEDEGEEKPDPQATPQEGPVACPEPATDPGATPRPEPEGFG